MSEGLTAKEIKKLIGMPAGKQGTGTLLRLLEHFETCGCICTGSATPVNLYSQSDLPQIKALYKKWVRKAVKN
jgi:hypothetical protein